MTSTVPQIKDSGNLSVHIPEVMEQVLNSEGQESYAYQPQTNNLIENTSTIPTAVPVSKPTMTGKNPVMCLNELRKGLNFELLEETQQGVDRQYTVRVVVDGEPFVATARSKKLAKQETSKFALLKLFNVLYMPDYQSPPDKQLNEDIDLKRKAEINVPGQKKKRKVMPKNAVMLLNEFRAGLEFKVISCTGPVHNPSYVIGVDIGGQRYEGTGKSKKAAKVAAAENALRAYPEKYSKLLEEKSMMDATTLHMADSTTACLPPSVSVGDLNNKHPCMALNEIRPGLEYLVLSEQGPPHDRQYVMSVMIDGEVFNGSGRSKKEAKHNAAISALSHLSGV